MGRSFADELALTEDPGGFKLPGILSARFDIRHCLSENEDGLALLLIEKQSGKPYVLKGSRHENAPDSVKEAQLLRELNHRLLPQYEMEFDDGDMSYILREYAEGVPLGHYVSERGELTAELAVNITLQICDVLSYLHARPSPIIHRDVKPANIIINPQDQTIKLIDFGIARVYSETADTDTVYFGTRKYSPPEQYGFSQTDHRADIFSAGVVLRFMLTGETNGTVRDKRLARIVNKCSAFDPEQRYGSASALRRALISYRHRLKQKLTVSALSLAAVSLSILAGIFIGRYIEAHKPYPFEEPLIEQAVRAQLGIAQGAVTQDDLLRVEALGVSGPEVLTMDGADDSANDQAVSRFFNLYEGLEYGGIRSLDDIAMMKNIKYLALPGQDITDLSPLKGLPLERLVLEGNPISDITALRYCPDIYELALSNTRVRDVSVVRNLLNMETLGLCATYLASFEQLRDSTVAYLHAWEVPAKDFGTLAILPNLEWLAVSPQSTDELDAVCSAEGIHTLNLFNTNIDDYEPLKRLRSLSEVEIHGFFNDAADFSVFSEVTGLQRVKANTWSAALIEAANPNPGFELVVQD